MSSTTRSAAAPTQRQPDPVIGCTGMWTRCRLARMTVERNVIMCDGQHVLLIGIVPDVPAQFVTPARIRIYAHMHGWIRVAGGDFWSLLAGCVAAAAASGYLFIRRWRASARPVAEKQA